MLAQKKFHKELGLIIVVKGGHIEHYNIMLTISVTASHCSWG